MKAEAPSYAAFAFHPAYGNEEIAGRIRLDPQKVLFESEAANVELSLDRLNIEREASDRLLLSSADETDWLVYTPDEAILKDYFFTRRNRLRLLAREIRRQKEGKRALKRAAVFLASFAAVAMLVWLLTGWTVSFLVRQVPVSWEVQLADAAYDEIKDHVVPVDDPKLTAELRALTDRLAAALPDNKYKFRPEVIDTPVPNAVALPGGRILVTTGLFKLADRPEELAGVLAHEMAHVIKRHGLRKIISAAGPYYVLRIFVSDRHGFVSLISNGSQLLVQQSFSRDLERDADETGWHYLEAANIDPRGLTEALRKLMADSLTRKIEESSLRILSSHPPTAERVEHLEKSWEHARKKTGFVDLQTIVPWKTD